MVNLGVETPLYLSVVEETLDPFLVFVGLVPLSVIIFAQYPRREMNRRNGQECAGLFIQFFPDWCLDDELWSMPLVRDDRDSYGG